MNRATVMRAIERAEALDAELARGGKDEFYLGWWIDDNPRRRCGFSGCLVGWASHASWFDDLGCRILIDQITRIPYFVFGGCVVRHPTDGAAALFGVESDTSRLIIYEESYPREWRERNGEGALTIPLRRVIERMRRLLDMDDEGKFRESCWRDRDIAYSEEEAA